MYALSNWQSRHKPLVSSAQGVNITDTRMKIMMTFSLINYRAAQNYANQKHMRNMHQLDTHIRVYIYTHTRIYSIRVYA